MPGGKGMPAVSLPIFSVLTASARRDAAGRLRRQAEAEATIQGDPLVRELLAQFKTARIVPGSIKPIAN